MVGEDIHSRKKLLKEKILWNVDQLEIEDINLTTVIWLLL